MRKNVASQTVCFQMNSATDGSAVTAGTPTVYYTIDGGTQGTGAGASTHEGNGCWSYVPAQAETNGSHVAFTMALSGAISQTVNVWPVSYDPGDAVRIGITALPNAAADAAGGLPISDAGGLDMDNMVTNSLNAYDPPTNTEMTAAFTEIKGATWNSATDTLEAIRDRGDAAWITAVSVTVSDKTGFSLAADQSGVTIGTVNTMAGTIGTLDALDTAQDTQHASTQADIAALNDPTAAAIATAVLTTQMTEAYAADGVAPTMAQALFAIQQFLQEKAVTSTTLTVKKLDGTTSAMTFTLDSDTAPTSITRAT